ncbi:Putative transposase of IS4/5 family [Geodermatophilus amargosae]|uniref:Putative transposase of IS4/5 family n=1 Tax=Geodermatophilus amargosae TaxID=1296565 RepID=A0A1I7B0T6_9ACTN|nr:Putative transposase of IS4/5 family [Geodermatophilus amargosae]
MLAAVLRLWWVTEELLPDGMWERVAPLLPAPKPRRHWHPGRLPVDDRAALAGIVFVLRTGIAWNQLPAGLVGCSGITCWRRLRDWTEAGVWPALHEALLAELRAGDVLELDPLRGRRLPRPSAQRGPTSARRRSTEAVPAPSTT